MGPRLPERPRPATSSVAEPRGPIGRGARLRLIAKRVSLAAELLLIVGGAAEFWRASAVGQPVSRPAQIAFWAGVIGLLANLVVSVVRARAARASRIVAADER